MKPAFRLCFIHDKEQLLMNVVISKSNTYSIYFTCVYFV